MELALELGWKIALTALMIVAVARVAERAGALMASVLLTVPMNAGPGFFFLALDHPAPFIAEGVLVSFAATGAVLVFAAAYVNLARRFDFFVCVGGASLAWLIAAIAFSWVELDLARACALIAGGAIIAFVSRRRLDLYSAPDHGPSALRPQFARGLVAGAWAAGFATLGHLIGPKLAGLTFGFPIIFCTAAWTVHRTWREFRGRPAELGAALAGDLRELLPRPLPAGRGDGAAAGVRARVPGHGGGRGKRGGGRLVRAAGRAPSPRLNENSSPDRRPIWRTRSRFSTTTPLPSMTAARTGCPRR